MFRKAGSAIYSFFYQKYIFFTVDNSGLCLYYWVVKNTTRRPQLLAKVWEPIIESLDTLLERACLKRDAFLDHVFAHEAARLPVEIPAPNSAEARRYLQRCLRNLEPKQPVTFALSHTTIESVNRACESLNIIRDCFINRVLFLLVADLDRLEMVTDIELRSNLGDFLSENDRDFLYQDVWDGSLRSVSDIVTSDPFRAWRNVIDYEREQKRDSTPLHACVISPGLFKSQPPGAYALNCYLPDESVPGTPANERGKQSLEDLFGDLTPKYPKPRKKGKKVK